jgi:hypothetical protein
LWVITLYGELVSYFFAGSKSAIGDLWVLRWEFFGFDDVVWLAFNPLCLFAVDWTLLLWGCDSVSLNY